MSCIFYYSNSNEACKMLIREISKSKDNLKDFHFVCVDRRVKGPDGNQYAILENGRNFIIPVKEIPAIILIKQDYKIIYLPEIIQYLKGLSTVQIQQATNNNLEPSAFSFSSGSGVSSVMSDSFSFLDSEANDLLSTGNGGTRQMHNYVLANQDFKINTPTDDFDYKGSTKLSQEVTVEKLQQQREMDYQNVVSSGPRPIM